MKNKKTKRKVSRKRGGYSTEVFRIVIAFTLVVVFLAGAYVYKTAQPNSPCANSISCVNDLSGNYDFSATTGEFMGKTYQAPQYIALSPSNQSILGQSSGSNKRIFIDLALQKLFAKEGDLTIFEFPVSTGLWGTTPTGDFKFWIKLRYTRMRGGDKKLGTYYDVPNVPYTMFFYNSEIPKWRGYAVHGAYWHNDFGRPKSHGCINLKPTDAEKLYHWADPAPTGSTTKILDENAATPVTIYGKAPLS